MHYTSKHSTGHGLHLILSTINNSNVFKLLIKTITKKFFFNNLKQRGDQFFEGLKIMLWTVFGLGEPFGELALI